MYLPLDGQTSEEHYASRLVYLLITPLGKLTTGQCFASIPSHASTTRRLRYHGMSPPHPAIKYRESGANDNGQDDVGVGYLMACNGGAAPMNNKPVALRWSA